MAAKQGNNNMVSVNSGASIMQYLTQSDIDNLQKQFTRLNRGEGLSLQKFVEVLAGCMLQRGQKMSKSDNRMTDPVILTALLVELFKQIDVNANGLVDWEEFEEHCIEPLSDEIEESENNKDGHQIHSLNFEIVPCASPNRRRRRSRSSLHDEEQYTKKDLSVEARNISWIPELQRVLVVEGESVSNGGLKEIEGRCVRLYARDLDTFTRVRLKISEEKFSKTSIITCLFLHSEKRHQLAVLTSDKYIMIFDWGTGTNSLGVLSEEPKFKLLAANIQTVAAFCPVSDRLFTAGGDGVIFVWDLKAMALQSYLLGHHTDAVTSLLYTAHLSRRYLVSASLDSSILLWDLKEAPLSTPKRLKGHTLGVTQLAFSSMYDVVVSGACDFKVLVWDVNKLSSIASMFHASLITSIAVVDVDEQEQHVVTSTEKGVLRLWRLGQVRLSADVPCVFVLKPGVFDNVIQSSHPPRFATTVDPNSDFIVSCGKNLRRFSCVRMKARQHRPTIVLYSSSLISFVTIDRTNIFIWNALGKLVMRLNEVTELDITAATLDYLGRRLIVGCASGQIKVIDLMTGHILKESTEEDCHLEEIIELSYCNSNSTIVSSSCDRTLRVFDDRAEDTLPLLRGIDFNPLKLSHIAISDSLCLIAVCVAESVLLLDFQTLDVLMVCQAAHEHVSRISAVTFVNGWEAMATADEDGIVLLWHVSRKSTFPHIELIGRLDMTVTPPPTIAEDVVSLPPGVVRGRNNSTIPHDHTRKRFTTAGNDAEKNIASLLYSSRKESLAHILEQSHHSSVGVSSLQSVIPPDRSERSSIVNRESFVFLVASLDSGKIVSWNVKRIFESYRVNEIHDATSYKNVCTLKHSYKPYLKLGLKSLCSTNSTSVFKSTVSSTLTARMKARRNHSVLTYPKQKQQQKQQQQQQKKEDSTSSLRRKTTRKMSRLPMLTKASRLSKAPMQFIFSTLESSQLDQDRRKTRLKQRKTVMYNDATKAEMAANAVHIRLQRLTKNYTCTEVLNIEHSLLRSWSAAYSPITAFQAIYSPINRDPAILMCSERGCVNIFSMWTLRKIGELCVKEDLKAEHFATDNASSKWSFVTAEDMKEIEYRKQRDAVKLLRKIVTDNARMKEKSKTKKNWKLVKTSIERREILRIFKQHYLYPSLDKQLVDLAIDVMERRRVKPEELLIKQGDKGNHFYICATGTYAVIVNGKEVAQYQASLQKGGMAFGELSILYDTRRSATIKALKPGVIYTVGRENFLKYLTPPDFKEEKSRRSDSTRRGNRRGSVADNCRKNYRGSIVHSRPSKEIKQNILRNEEIEQVFEVLGVDRTGLSDIDFSSGITSTMNNKSNTPVSRDSEKKKKKTVTLRHHNMLMQILKPQESTTGNENHDTKNSNDDSMCGTKIDIDEIGEFVTKLDIDHEEKEHERTFSGRKQKASLAVRHTANENTKRLRKLGLLDVEKVPHVPVKLYSNFMSEYRRKEDSFRLSHNKKSHEEVLRSLSKKSKEFFVKKRRSNMNSERRSERKQRLLHIAKAAAGELLLTKNGTRTISGTRSMSGRSNVSSGTAQKVRFEITSPPKITMENSSPCLPLGIGRNKEVEEDDEEKKPSSAKQSSLSPKESCILKQAKENSNSSWLMKPTEDQLDLIFTIATTLEGEHISFGKYSFVQKFLCRLLLRRGHRQKLPKTAEDMMIALHEVPELYEEIREKKSTRGTSAACVLAAIAEAKLCGVLSHFEFSETEWDTIMERKAPGLTFPWRKIYQVVKGDFGSGENSKGSSSSSSSEDFGEEKKNVSSSPNQKNASSQTILEQRTRNWYRRHLDHIIQRSSSSKSMPLPRFGTIAAEEVLTVHALYTDVVTSAKPETRDGLVTWSSLLNSKRWQSLPHTPHITGDINRKMTYKELLRSMFPQASSIQIQAMQRFSPSHF